MEQAKDYAECTKFHVQYVFATNGHRYGEFDKGTRIVDSIERHGRAVEAALARLRALLNAGRRQNDGAL